jgi:hypothetical protein
MRVIRNNLAVSPVFDQLTVEGLTLHQPLYSFKKLDADNCVFQEKNSAFSCGNQCPKIKVSGN